MAVDLNALKKIAEGEPSSKVMVTRRWLGEVYRMLKRNEDEREIRKAMADIGDMLYGGRKRP